MFWMIIFTEPSDNQHLHETDVKVVSRVGEKKNQKSKWVTFLL